MNSDPLDWLLEDNNPSVRYFALRNLLDYRQDHPDVIDTQSNIMKMGLVPQILAGQKSEGFWESPEDFYIRTKYRGTVWQIIILAELGAQGNDPAIDRACEFILTWSQNRESGGFAYRGSGANGGQSSAVLPCLTGNMIWSLLRFGKQEDPRVQAGLRWLSLHQRYDDGDTEPPPIPPYKRFEMCWGRHTCTPGAVKALKAAAEIPVQKQDAEITQLITRASEFLLQHRLFKRSHDLTRAAKPKWTHFGFPTMWDTDAMEMADILLRLEIRDPRMQEAVDLIVGRQDVQGRWSLENTFNGRFRFNIERKGRPSKWVTLLALRVLKNYYQEPAP